MLRPALVILGIVAIGVGALLIASGYILPAGVYLVGSGLILVLGILFERRGYRPRVDRRDAHWEKTSERFIDPVSGHVVDVLYNPETGERDYVDTGQSE